MSLSRLTVGTERIPAKPPRGQPPCTEPIVYGANILRDPGFELHVANTGGGPEGDEIPGLLWDDGGGLPLVGNDDVLHWSDGTTANPNLTGWFGDDLTIPDYGWRASDADPRSGTYHLRGTKLPGFASQRSFFPVGVVSCGPESGTAPANHWPFYAARINAGDYIRFSFWAKLIRGDPADDAIINQIGLKFLDAEGDIVGTVGKSFPILTTTYQQFEWDGFAPVGVHFLTVEVEIQFQLSAFSPWVLVDVDDCVLEVQD